MRSVFSKNYGYVFLHIPKTAGTSARSVFADLLSPKLVSPHFGAAKISSEQALELAQYRLISGHISWIDIERRFPKRKILTFLRDPIDRCVSWYHFTRALPLEKVIPLDRITNTNDPKEAISLAKQLDFETFLSSQHPHVLQNLENRQTWQLGAHADVELRAGNGERVLEAAKRNLQRIDAVGFSEFFSEDLRRMVEGLGMGTVASVPRENATGVRPRTADLAPAIKSKLEALNALDIELYRYARGMVRNA
jgi:hypothetical protein